MSWPTPADAAEMFEAVERSRASLDPWLPWVEGHTTLDDEERFVRLSVHDARLGERYEYLLRDADTRRVIGGVSVHSISWAKACAEVGYWLTDDARGRGLATVAVRRLCDELFSLGFERLEIRCDPENTPSAALAARAGFHLEGVLRHERWFRGWRDTMVWSRLAGDRVGRRGRR